MIFMPGARSPTIYVCALRHVPEMIRRTGARCLISAINIELLPDTPPTVSAARHLKLDMHDVVEALPGWIPPSKAHVIELVDFMQSWDRRAPMVVHCFAGLSRSTAAAFIGLCALNPHTSEEIIARTLRRSSDSAVPNRLFVALADNVLRRDGRMLAALNCMGRHRNVAECKPFGIEVRGPSH